MVTQIMKHAKPTLISMKALLKNLQQAPSVYQPNKHWRVLSLKIYFMSAAISNAFISYSSTAFSGYTITDAPTAFMSYFSNDT